MLHLKVLIIDNNSDQAEDLVEQLQPEVCPDDCVFVSSFPKALEILVQDTFNAIFISDSLNPEGLEHFLNDIKNLKEKNSISLINIQTPRQDGDKTKENASKIFDATISRTPSHTERKNLRAFMQHQYELAQEREKIGEVADAVDHILSQVDDAAIARKRGADQPLTSVHRDYVASYARISEKIMEKFVDTLTEQAEKRAPTKVPKIAVSEKMLKRKPPKLSATGYSGVSTRVWDKLSNKLGPKDDINVKNRSEGKINENGNCLNSKVENKNRPVENQATDDSSSDQAVLACPPDEDET